MTLFFCDEFRKESRYLMPMPVRITIDEQSLWYQKPESEKLERGGEFCSSECLKKWLEEKTR